MVLRRAARVAQRAKGEVLVLHVRDPEREGEGAKGALDALRGLAGDVGGKWIEVQGTTPQGRW